MLEMKPKLPDLALPMAPGLADPVLERKSQYTPEIRSSIDLSFPEPLIGSQQQGFVSSLSYYLIASSMQSDGVHSLK
jgi:hypothetical protein